MKHEIRLEVKAGCRVEVARQKFGEGHVVNPRDTVVACLWVSTDNADKWKIEIDGHPATRDDIIAVGQGRWTPPVEDEPVANSQPVTGGDEGDGLLSLREGEVFPSFGQGKEALAELAASHGIEQEEIAALGTFTGAYNSLRERFGLPAGKDKVSYEESQAL